MYIGQQSCFSINFFNISPAVTTSPSSNFFLISVAEIFPMLSGGMPALQPIFCDIYEPTGDNLTNRPVVILAHTGSFLPQVINGQPTGNKTDSSIVQQCMRWARKGYVAVAMNNRLGWNPLSANVDERTKTLLQAAYRGIQDAKAMVRFLRKTEDLDGNPYGIDPNKIVKSKSQNVFVSYFVCV